MARRSEGDASSLELLLDTVCNTFGGILFLAMLVCLMVGSKPPVNAHDAGPGAERVDAATVAALDSEASRLARAIKLKREMLVGAAADTAGAASVSGRWVAASAEESKLREETRELQARLDRARHEPLPVADSDPRVREVRSSLEEARARLASARNDASKAKGELADARTDAEEQRRRNAVQLRLPQERVTNKRQIAWVLSGGRLFSPILYDGDGDSIGPNPAEVIVETLVRGFGPEDLRTRAGSIVRSDLPLERVITRRLDGAVSTTRFVTLLTYPDSYAEFRLVRDALVKAGFEYEVILLPEGGKIGSGSGPRRVQ